MKIEEMGNMGGKTLMLLPGTCCDWQTYFGSVLDILSEKYHLICVNYDGFDGSDSIFVDEIIETEKIEQDEYRIYTKMKEKTEGVKIRILVPKS